MESARLHTMSSDAASRAAASLMHPSPAIIVPAQVWDGAPARHVPDGIRRLMVAILDDAICVVRKHRHAPTRDKRRLHLRARRWLESDDRSFVFSFLRIAEALGIEPDLVRRALRGGPTRDRSRST